eukprot:TRINITY_DN39971_c0_g1_i1.p2 TRINITY_DN39971_c0_g1~~TRINITY_DN39971_c0_g1_i1.p2  ORF type:complete len:207 (+),score=66.70 TRINITY_DN39971_c0_g1_i1:113-733(+)
MAMGGGVDADFDYAKYCIPGEINVHEVQDMKRAFDMIDEDKSGFITAEELQGAAVALGLPMETNISVLLGLQKIDFDEFFQRMTGKLGLGDNADYIMTIFELFDNDGTGTISFNNLQNIARIIGAKETPQEIQDMLTTLDTDGDNEMDPIEFYTCLVSGTRLRLEAEDKEKMQTADAMARLERQESGLSRGGGVSTASRGNTLNLR